MSSVERPSQPSERRAATLNVGTAEPHFLAFFRMARTENDRKPTTLLTAGDQLGDSCWPRPHQAAPALSLRPCTLFGGITESIGVKDARPLGELASGTSRALGMIEMLLLTRPARDADTQSEGFVEELRAGRGLAGRLGFRMESEEKDENSLPIDHQCPCLACDCR